MKTSPQPVYILGSQRIPFAKSQTAYADITRQNLMVASLEALVDKCALQNKLLGDVALGALMNSAANWNLSRECVLATALHPETPAYNVQRACGTSLETIWQIALKAHVGQINTGIAGGVDTNSDFPIEISDALRHFILKLTSAKTLVEKVKALKYFSLQSLKPKAASVTEPRTLLSMGQHCELMVKEWGISRDEQDELALRSHQNSYKAYEDGFMDGLVQPFNGLNRDNTIRGDTSLEKLVKLKPAFDYKNGSLTAGNSSPLTDGSACILLANDVGANELGIKPLAQLIDFQIAAVDFVHGAGLLMAPTHAVANLLSRNNLSFADFDYFEIHEAFAGQVLCNLKAWNDKAYCQKVLGLPSALGQIDRSKLNVMGSSIAMGHPFAATGARIAGTLAKLSSRNKNRRGLISICTAGGMGIAALLES